MVEARPRRKYVRTSAQKAGLVLDLIRGKDVNRALSTLQFTRKSVARDVAKVLRSAIANAQQKDGFGGDVERLFVSACYANQGPSQKRVRPAPMGRAFRILKRTAHLTVQVRSVRRRLRQSGRGAAAKRRAKKPASVRRKPAKKAKGVTVGQKVHPYRVPPRVQQDVAVALVRGQGLREAAARGPRR